MEKEIAVEKVNLDFSKHFSTDADYKELFKIIRMRGYKIDKINNIQISQDSLISIISTVDLKTGDNERILIFGISGQPTYKQMCEVAYNDDLDIDTRIIMFYHPEEPECKYKVNKLTVKTFANLLNNCQMETFFIEIVASEDKDSNDSFSYTNMMGPYNQTQTNYQELPPQSLFQEGEIWEYFNQYAYENDPSGPFADWECDGLPGLDPDHWLFARPDYVDSVGCAWDENGMSLIVEEISEYEQQKLKNLFQNRKTELEETFEDSKIIFQSEPCKLIVTIDERPISECIDLPFDQNKIMLEKLAEYQMLFYQKFCLSQ
jgi:hypothetical protein